MYGLKFPKADQVVLIKMLMSFVTAPGTGGGVEEKNNFITKNLLFLRFGAVCCQSCWICTQFFVEEERPSDTGRPCTGVAPTVSPL